MGKTLLKRTEKHSNQRFKLKVFIYLLHYLDVRNTLRNQLVYVY